MKGFCCICTHNGCSLVCCKLAKLHTCKIFVCIKNFQVTWDVCIDHFKLRFNCTVWSVCDHMEISFCSTDVADSDKLISGKLQ